MGLWGEGLTGSGCSLLMGPRGPPEPRPPASWLWVGVASRHPLQWPRWEWLSAPDPGWPSWAPRLFALSRNDIWVVGYLTGGCVPVLSPTPTSHRHGARPAALRTWRGEM